MPTMPTPAKLKNKKFQKLIKTLSLRGLYRLILFGARKKIGYGILSIALL